jgi:hypothetical protein
MKRLTHITALAAVALCVAAAPALAAGFSLDLVPQSQAVVGTPMMVNAVGTIPPQDVQFPYWFSLVWIPTSFTTSCPTDHFEGAQIATASGGGIIVLRQSERPDPAGNFSIPVAMKPNAAGSVLLCGYTDDGEALALANTGLILDIKPAPSSQSGGSTSSNPAATVRPGIRSCRALLAGAELKGCIRDVVRHANAGCRRLHSPAAKTRCLLAVRRAANGR